MKVTLLGGKGLLGRSLAHVLTDSAHDVVVSSRSAGGPGEVLADLTTGDGLAEAVGGSDVVVHLVSDVRNQQKTDIAGTQRLLQTLDDQHLVYMSIVGIEDHPYRYYRTKLEVEKMIERLGRPHTSQRPSSTISSPFSSDS